MRDRGIDGDEDIASKKRRDERTKESKETDSTEVRDERQHRKREEIKFTHFRVLLNPDNENRRYHRRES